MLQALKLSGIFNVYNSLTAAALCDEVGIALIPDEAFRASMEKAMEMLSEQGQGK